MRVGVLVCLLCPIVAVPAAARAADQVDVARRLYNEERYDAALEAAQEAAHLQGESSSVRLLVGRIQLERYRRTAEPDELASARAALREVDAPRLDARERLELTVGLAELLYFDDRFGAAAELLEPVLDASAVLGAAAHERTLDWWATALDREAQSHPDAGALHARLLERMEHELQRDPGSTPASYWLAAAARAAGDLDRAWAAAGAGWVRAPLARDRGARLRADLDRLVRLAIIPERVVRLHAPDAGQALAGMLNEWEAFKTQWAR